MYDVIVIGGGAAGLIAAGFASRRNKKVILLEKNAILGRKLLITGKGRCNVTNYSNISEHISNCVVNGKFLNNIYHQFFVKDIVKFFEERNVKLKTERGNRIFPESDKAADIVHALMKFIDENRVEVINQKVVSIEKIDSFFKIKTAQNIYKCYKVIICTGGLSYPGTGSTGDGYKFAKKLGHKIITPNQALVPIETIENYPSQMQGLSLKNVRIKIKDPQNKLIFDSFGEMLFTHFGISGPLILSASSLIKNIEQCKLYIDLKPALSFEQLNIRLLNDFQNNSNKSFKKVFKFYLPSKMIPVMLEITNIDPDRKCHSITKKERNRLVEFLKAFPLTLKKYRSISEGIITSGGVDVKEINPTTLESLLVKGLYFAGEIIDVDALTGGYNLQIAWSTGFVAGNSV